MAHPAPYGREACEERLAAWRSSTDPTTRDRIYAAVLRRHFGPDDPVPLAPYEEVWPHRVVDTDPL